MKKMRGMILLLACILLLTGCACKHEWTAADCVTPESCTKCGETAGEALGHEWTEASCTTVRTCSRCGRTEGDPLGHAWTEATCTAPKTCSVCGETVGEAAAHTWTDATCTAAKTCSVCGAIEGEPLEHLWMEATTDEPATCSVCGITEGEKVETDPRFATNAVESLLGSWEAELALSEEDLSIRRYNGTLEGTYRVEFRNDGTAHGSIELKDEEAFRAAVAEFCADLFFEELENEEISEEQADVVVKALMDQTVEEAILEMQRSVSAEELIVEMLAETKYDNDWLGDFVYYVEDGKLYIDDKWEDELHEKSFEHIGATLLLFDFLECKPVENAN